MNLSKLVSITGVGGIYKMLNSNNNGIIVESMEDGTRRFVSSRANQYVLLDTLSIYTEDGDTLPLSKVFQNMLDQYEDNPPVASGASDKDLLEYFEDVLPTYDKNKVHLSHMKKLIKWFTFLKKHNFFEAETAADKA